MVGHMDRASYRDLLRTADSIIEMDGHMHHIEAYLGEMGKNCNTRLLEKKGSNLGALNDMIGATGACLSWGPV